MQLLHLDSSVLGTASVSRQLSARTVASPGPAPSAGSAAAALEHQESYLIGLLAFLGVVDLTVVRAEGLALGAQAKDAAISRALADIAALSA